jgi:hypothetical protein
VSQSKQTALYLAMITSWFYMATIMCDLPFMILQGLIGFITGYNFVQLTYGRLWAELDLVTPEGDIVPVRP